MFISWKTDGTAGAVDTVENWLASYDDPDYQASTTASGRVFIRKQIVGDDLFITEEWNLTREEYDALDITKSGDAQYDGTVLPLIETDEHGAKDGTDLPKIPAGA